MNKRFLPSVTLVLGGANSGKSGFAEDLITASGLPRIYCATAQAFDEEMADKIRAHRETRGDDWMTRDCPLALSDEICALPAGSAALVDCLTMWLSNHLLDGADLAAQESKLLTALGASACPLVIVSNEVGLGIVPDNALSRRFRTAQGRLNQAVAARADLVVTVMAGLPLVLKGTMPV